MTDNGILGLILAQLTGAKNTVVSSAKSLADDPAEHILKSIKTYTDTLQSQVDKAYKGDATDIIDQFVGAGVTRGTRFFPGQKVIMKSGERGTVERVRQVVDNKVEDPNSPWMKKRKELADQAAQGYIDGQFTFEHYTQIFDKLLEDNKDVLRQLYKAPHPEGSTMQDIPRILLDGETRARSVNLEDILSVLSGPQGIVK